MARKEHQKMVMTQKKRVLLVCAILTALLVAHGCAGTASKATLSADNAADFDCSCVRHIQAYIPDNHTGSVDFEITVEEMCDTYTSAYQPTVDIIGIDNGSEPYLVKIRNETKQECGGNSTPSRDTAQDNMTLQHSEF